MRIAAIDDDAQNRSMISEWIGNLFEAESIEVTDQPVTGERIAELVRAQRIDAVIVDHKLGRNGYSVESGLAIAAYLNRLRIPTVLATSYQRSEIREFVWFGRDVPAVVKKGNFESELELAMRTARSHVVGELSPESTPYPTIARIDALDEKEVGLIVSAFSPEQGILVDRADLERRLQIELRTDLRFSAEVNIRAVSVDQLFLSNIAPLTELSPEYAAMLRD